MGLITSMEQYFFIQFNLGTIMTVIDNSLVVGNTGGGIFLTMGYGINILYDEEY